MAEVSVFDIARACHEANRALQMTFREPVSLPWDELDPETRASAVDGVCNALDGTTPERSHENWMRFKLDHGWKYGTRKDLEAKTHPLLVPYDELPRYQQLKDHMFLAIVQALGGGLSWPASR